MQLPARKQKGGGVVHSRLRVIMNKSLSDHSYVVVAGAAKVKRTKNRVSYMRVRKYIREPAIRSISDTVIMCRLV